MQLHAPYFSIVMPVFNRATLVRRALESCLSQSFADFEIVVVDDGSTDSSHEIVAAYADPRMRLLRHSVNRGVCPARNTAIAAAAGEWVICLDSDDELVEGALKTIFDRVSQVPPEVCNVRFMCRFDSGELSPRPAFGNGVLNYESYIRWLALAMSGRHEAFICMRRPIFQVVRFPDSRATEAKFHLDFAQRFLTLDCPEIVRLYHQDADNALCSSRPAGGLLASAHDEALMHSELVREHGEALQGLAPVLLLYFLRGAAVYFFLAGRRRDGLRYSLRYLRARPFSLRMLVVAASGVCGKHTLLLLKQLGAQR
jgi:glycosyltransferase involved in cell wall biosynthesis